MADRITKFVTATGYLCAYNRFGFTRKHSTVLGVINYIDLDRAGNSYRQVTDMASPSSCIYTLGHFIFR